LKITSLLRPFLLKNPLLTFASTFLWISFLHFLPLAESFISIIFLIPVWHSFCKNNKKQALLLALASVLFFLYLLFSYQLPPDNRTLIANVEFEVLSSKPGRAQKNPAQSCRIFVKKVIDKKEMKTLAKGFPASTYIKKELGAVQVGRLYQAEAEVFSTAPLHYQVKLLSPLKKGKQTFSLLPLRQRLQKKVKTLIAKQDIHSDSKEVFVALSTGEMTASMTMFHMKQFGLLHLLAISGLHFGLVAYFFKALLTFIKNERIKNLCLWIILSFYFFFIGLSASVLRAFSSISLTILALLLNLKPRALNILSASLLFSLIHSPLFIFSIGFQFSYLITFAILLGFHPMQRFLELSLVPFAQKIKLSTKGTVFKTSSSLIALSFAVSAASIPLSFFHFKTFPLASIYYNLFFPFLFSFCLYLLITAFLLYPIFPYLASLLFQANGFYTHCLLQSLDKAPIQHQRMFWFDSLGPASMLCFISAFILSMLYLDKEFDSSGFHLKFWP
jgi:ComEC/Rec2-related protein